MAFRRSYLPYKDKWRSYAPSTRPLKDTKMVKRKKKRKRMLVTP